MKNTMKENEQMLREKSGGIKLGEDREKEGEKQAVKENMKLLKQTRVRN